MLKISEKDVAERELVAAAVVAGVDFMEAKNLTRDDLLSWLIAFGVASGHDFDFESQRFPIKPETQSLAQRCLLARWNDALERALAPAAQTS